MFRSLPTSKTSVMQTLRTSRTRSLIYLTDSSQSVGDVAKDVNGNDLIWSNDNVMCDDASICDFTTEPLSRLLGAGDFLGGGKLTLHSQAGATSHGRPSRGEYMVSIDVDADGDADTSNDAELVYVIVEDWFDISVDLVWLVDDGTGTGTLVESDSDFFDAANVDAFFQVEGPCRWFRHLRPS